MLWILHYQMDRYIGTDTLLLKICKGKHKNRNFSKHSRIVNAQICSSFEYNVYSLTNPKNREFAMVGAVRKYLQKLNTLATVVPGPAGVVFLATSFDLNRKYSSQKKYNQEFVAHLTNVKCAFGSCLKTLFTAVRLSNTMQW